MNETANTRRGTETGSVDRVATWGVFTGVGIGATAANVAGTPQSMTGAGIGMVIFAVSLYKLGKHAGWDDE